MDKLLKFYIKGDWVDPLSDDRMRVLNPASVEQIGEVALGGEADVDRAVSAAAAAFDQFSLSSKAERLDLLARIRAVTESRFEELAQAMRLEMGAPITMAREAQADAAIGHLDGFVAALEKLEEQERFENGEVLLREPIGVCGLITPWNWPMNQVVLKVLPVIATGCTCVLKPSEHTPVSAMIYAEILDEAGVPAGVFNLVNGVGPVVGGALSRHPDVQMMSFTGSTRAGKAVTRDAADSVKRVTLELGGKSPNLVFADCDLEERVTQSVAECMFNSGQSCDAPTRLLVERSCYDEVVEIGVHIADVSAYVKPQTPLDVEAQNRGNSTYLVGSVIPMLPHSLSNGLCSLVEAEDRLTKSVIVQFNKNAEIQKVEFANTVIRSNKRLTYKQALAFLKQEDLDQIKQTPLPPKHQTGSIGRDLKTLDKKELSHLKKSIRTLWSIASHLRKRRFKKGSLDLDMNELKIYVDKEGYAERLEKQVNDISHQLIEEFMLVANEQIARLSKRERITSIYRVHDKPEDTRLVELRQIMRTYGVPCNQLSKPVEMSRLLKQLKEHPQSYALKLQVLKSLKQAQYRPTPDGHYGLSKTDYSHFTSPIRRYSDLIVHRILDAYLMKSNSKYAPKTIDIRYGQSTLESITQHLNVTERNSVDAERESTKVKLLEYFEQELKINPPNDFDAIITDVKNHGLFIELVESQAFGFVHISNLGKDMYFLSSNEQNIVGKKTKQIFSLGQRIKVNVLKVDRFKRQLDFCISAQSNIKKFGGISISKGDMTNSPKELNKLRKFRRSIRKK